MSEHLRAIWAGLRTGRDPLDIYSQGGLHLGIMTTAEAEVAEQIRRLMEPEAKPSEQDVKSRFRHVLAPVPKGPRGSGFYHVDRPAVKPLCGAEGTTDDLSWGDSKSKAAREWITCPDCLRLRDEKLGVTKTASTLECQDCGGKLKTTGPFERRTCTSCGAVFKKDGPRVMRGRKTAATTSSLEVRDFEGRVGDRTHLTRRELGTLPTHTISHLPGVMGEVPGEHRTKHGAEWDAFKSDIGQHGIKQPIFITVDHGQEPRISEGNHRRDAAVELGLSHVPVEISYFGHAEQQGTVADRAPKLKTASDTPKYKEGDRVYRYVWSGDRHDPSGLVSTHAIQPLTIKKVSPKTYRVSTDHGGEFQLPHHHIEGYVDWEDD